MPIKNKGNFNLSDVVRLQIANDWPTAQVTSTSDIIEGTNQYFTNVRVLQVTNPRLTTANVIESVSNLYFTNARVNATVQPFLTAANIANFTSTVNTTVRPILTTANVIETSGNLYFTTDRVNATVQPFLTTANVIETSGNLYFTNTRVIFAAIPAVTELTVTTPVFNYNIDQYTGDNPAIYVSAGETIVFNLNVSGSHPFNIRVSDGGSNYNTGLTHIAQDGTVSTESSAQGKVTGKLFWKIPYVLAGNTYVYQCTNHSSMVGSIVIQRPVSTITTDNVTEGSNLYFTNTKVFNAITIGTITGDIAVTGNLVANGLIIRNIDVSDSVLAGNVTAGASVSNTIVADSVTSNTWNKLYTANVIETSGNLYFTNDRAVSAVTNTTLSNVTASSLKTGTLIVDNDSYGNVTITQFASVWGQASGPNPYSIVQVRSSDNTTGIGISAYATGGPTLYSSGNISLRTGASVRDKDFPTGGTNGTTISTLGISTTGGVSAKTVVANEWIGLYTANVIETSGNLYFTNARVVSALIAGDSITIEANGRISANVAAIPLNAAAVNAIVQPFLTTANVIESSANLYFTNTRARSAFSAGENIEITPEGVISSIPQAALVSNDSEIIVATANTLTYALSRNITDPRSILVIDEGLIQIPTIDYTTAASSITFSTQPAVNSNIEIRYFGIDSVARFSSTFLATVNTFVGTGSNVTFPLTITPGGTAYTSVIIDGVAQQTTAYSIVGSTIVFTEAPVANAVIDVRIYSGTVGSSFNTRTFVGNGVANTYAITSGFNAQNILVFENGVAQVADVDYTVDANSVITFATAPAANIVVQIRELGSVGANLVNQIVGRDLRTGNIEPFVNEAQNIGSANLRYNTLFLSAANSIVMGNTIISISGTTLTLTANGTTTVVGASGAQGSTNARTLGYNLVFGG